jgi:sugar phosphate isomerase/epimerase
VFVCASTECFPELGPRETIDRLVDLEYTGVELAIHETGGWLKPSEVLADVERAANLCRGTHRMTVAALSIDIEATGDDYYEQFTACCRLAKAIKVVTLVVGSSELGTPFNEEIERLKKMSAIAALEGAVVAMKTEVDRMSHDLDTSTVFCNNIPGLMLTLDPSCMVYGPNPSRGYEKLIDRVQHVHLRDTSKTEFQVRVGQGEIDYGKLVSQLQAARYNRDLSVHLAPQEEVDHEGEMRKIRLLLDSLL